MYLWSKQTNILWEMLKNTYTHTYTQTTGNEYKNNYQEKQSSLLGSVTVNIYYVPDWGYSDDKID